MIYEYPCPHRHKIIEDKETPHYGIYQHTCGNFYGLSDIDLAKQKTTTHKIPTDRALEAMRKQGLI